MKNLRNANCGQVWQAGRGPRGLEGHSKLGSQFLCPEEFVGVERRYYGEIIWNNPKQGIYGDMDRIWLGVLLGSIVAPIAILGGPPCHPSYWSFSLSGNRWPAGAPWFWKSLPQVEWVCPWPSAAFSKYVAWCLCNYTDRLNSETTNQLLHATTKKSAILLQTMGCLRSLASER